MGEPHRAGYKKITELFMKKILLILSIIVVTAALAGVVFIATFNVNNYKGALESQLQALLGSRVEIGRLSLEWKGGVRLGVEGFRVYSDEAGRNTAALSVDRAEAGLDLGPLMTRRLQISWVLLAKPQISLVRSKDGKITLRGCAPKEAPPAASEAAAGAAFAFNINVIRITDGFMRFTDNAGDVPSEIVIKKIDAEIKDVSMSTPVTFNIKAAVAGDRRDLETSGVIGGWLTNSVYLKDFKLDADLAAFGHYEIIRAIPALSRAGLREGLAGTVSANIRQIRFEGEKMSDLSGDIVLREGKIVLSQARVPIENINLDMSAEGSKLTIRSFSARMSNGAMKASAKIDDAFSSPRTALKLALEVRGLESFLVNIASFNQNLDGDARITFDGTLSGTTWPEISRSLAGTGTFALDKGVIINSNLLDQTVGALTVFPNLVDSMQGTAPAPAKQVMAEKYTILKPFSQTYNIEGGYIILPDFTLQSDYVDMRGAAKMSLAGDFSGAGMLKFNQSISGVMLSAVPQMRAITDPDGLVTFPIAFKAGSGSSFKVTPDMKYIGTKVAVQTAGDAVSGYLKKAMDASAAQEGSGAPADSKKPPKIKDFLKALSQ